MLDTPEQKRGGSTFSSLSGFIGRSLRLPSGELASPASIDKDVEAPHVKLTLQHGSTKMSVTVYHAEQFAGQSHSWRCRSFSQKLIPQPWNLSVAQSLWTPRLAVGDIKGFQSISPAHSERPICASAQF